VEKGEIKFDISARIKDSGTKIMVRKMGLEEMPLDGIVYYCGENGPIYTADELELEPEGMFTKKELEIIDWYLQEYGTQEGVDKEADRLRKKVSELLKKKQ
jgi:hypothetical protein